MGHAMTGTAQFAPMDDALFAQFADACTIKRGTDDAAPGRCIVEDGIEQVGEYGRVVGRATRVSFIKGEWDPQRGDQITIDDVMRPVESIDSDDGLVVQVILHG